MNSMVAAANPQHTQYTRTISSDAVHVHVVGEKKMDDCGSSDEEDLGPSSATSSEGVPHHYDNELRGPVHSKGTSNTLTPKQGLVKQVRREWLVHEDSALAYRLQEKEIEMHYGKNREERKTCRMDLKQAKSLQEEDDMGSALSVGKYVDNLFLQELEDERVAKELQEQIEREDALHNRILEQADKELAKKLQEGESRHIKRKTKLGESHQQFRPKDNQHHPCLPANKKDLASCYEDTLTRATRNLSLDSIGPAGRTSGVPSPVDQVPELVDAETQLDDLSKSLTLGNEDELRRLQEIKDEELALTMQEEEVTKTSQYYKDQQLAMEAQDRELAKLLQEKERLRAKKARHKAKSDLQSKGKSMDVEDFSRSEGTNSDRSECGSKRTPKRETSYFNPQGTNRSGGSSDGTSSPSKAAAGPRSRTGFAARSQSYDEARPHFERSPISPVVDDLPNVAMVLDPTYGHDLNGSQRKLHDPVGASTSTMQSGRHTRSLPLHPVDNSDNEYDVDDHVAPPYMPIQGQKRQTVDKRRKKSDNCKQQ